LNLLLIHGALGSASQLAKLQQALGGGHTIHVVELEGHGNTPATQPRFSMERFIADVRNVISANSIERTAIFGYSMGGYIALKLAAESPDNVTSVITLGTKMHWTPEIALLETSRLDASRIRANVPAFAVHLSKRHRGVPGGWELVLDRTTALMTELGSQPMIDSTILSQIRQPVRMMVGERDAIVSIEETASAVKSIPKGELAVLPNTPHPLEQTRVSLVASMIQDFLIESGSAPSI
jgi:pimeloyl-ACP methyl ester carboxylesterase